MPGIIRRPRIGIVDVTEIDDRDRDENKPRPQFCVRCKEMFHVNALLGPRVTAIDKDTGKPMPKAPDLDNWLECYNCGTVYAKYEVKQEPGLTSLVEPDIDPWDRDRNILESVRGRRKFDSTGK